MCESLRSLVLHPDRQSILSLHLSPNHNLSFAVEIRLPVHASASTLMEVSDAHASGAQSANLLPLTLQMRQHSASELLWHQLHGLAKMTRGILSALGLLPQFLDWPNQLPNLSTTASGSRYGVANQRALWWLAKIERQMVGAS